MKRPSKRLGSMVGNIPVIGISGGAAVAASSASTSSSAVTLLSSSSNINGNDAVTSDRMNYALLVALYTLQGIPMGLSASIPFLIQQKVRTMMLEGVDSGTNTGNGGMAKMAYNAQAIFALCSWPFSLKLLWAPIVDSCFSRRLGRRKSWLIPVQAMAGGLMVAGSDYVERQLGLSTSSTNTNNPSVENTDFNVKGVTAFFFVLYFLMATQDIAVDGWALTMLSKANRGRGPVCNSIGQNVGYFLSFVGFLALNDPGSSENLWRPLLRLKSKPGEGLVSLGGFIRFMGIFMLVITTLVGLFKKEVDLSTESNTHHHNHVKSEDEETNAMISKQSKQNHNVENDDDDDGDEPPELDASQIGLRETYSRLFAVCKLPAVQSLFVILLTYRFPTALSDNVKFLKAVEYGLSRQTTALLSPTVILPLGIAVPILASKVWHGHPLTQFLTAYRFRVTLVPLLDVCMLHMVNNNNDNSRTTMLLWTVIVLSTAGQTIANSLQFNAQMTFFASRVDPAIGGSYMTLLNTAANLGGTWPSSLVMYLMGQFTVPPDCSTEGGVEICKGGRDAYFPLQAMLCVLGVVWLSVFGRRVHEVANFDERSWRTDINSSESSSTTGKKNISNSTSDAYRGRGGSNQHNIEMGEMEKGASNKRGTLDANKKKAS